MVKREVKMMSDFSEMIEYLDYVTMQGDKFTDGHRENLHILRKFIKQQEQTLAETQRAFDKACLHILDIKGFGHHKLEDMKEQFIVKVGKREEVAKESCKCVCGVAEAVNCTCLKDSQRKEGENDD